MLHAFCMMLTTLHAKRCTRGIKIIVDVVVVLTLTRIIKSVVTGPAPVTLELRNTPGKEHKQTKGGARMYHS